GGFATAYHFGGPQARAPADEVFRDVLGFGRENIVLEPDVEGDVVLEAAQESHGNVSVAIDETGEHEMARCIDASRRCVLGFDLGATAHLHDRVALYGNRAVFKDAALGIHCHHGAANNHQVSPLPFLLRN